MLNTPRRTRRSDTVVDPEKEEPEARARIFQPPAGHTDSMEIEGDEYLGEKLYPRTRGDRI